MSVSNVGVTVCSEAFCFLQVDETIQDVTEL